MHCKTNRHFCPAGTIGGRARNSHCAFLKQKKGLRVLRMLISASATEPSKKLVPSYKVTDAGRRANVYLYALLDWISTRAHLRFVPCPARHMPGLPSSWGVLAWRLRRRLARECLGDARRGALLPFFRRFRWPFQGSLTGPALGRGAKNAAGRSHGRPGSINRQRSHGWGPWGWTHGGRVNLGCDRAPYALAAKNSSRSPLAGQKTKEGAVPPTHNSFARTRAKTRAHTR
jgi:hypothetical protein